MTSSSSSKPTVLVTGSAGHLGKALMLSLESYGYAPIGVDILPSDTTTVVGSISDESFVSGLFARHRFDHVINAATLHKPHVGSHAKMDFVRTNVEGTLLLLEESARQGQPEGQGRGKREGAVKTFIFLSTTSAFGSILATKKGQPAIWIDESVIGSGGGMAKNVYGATKEAAEDLCWLVAKENPEMDVVVLRTSRFFPEGDDAEVLELEDDENLKVLELAYRRVDVADVVGACVCAMRRRENRVGVEGGAAVVKSGGGGGGGGNWGRYVISAPTIFKREEDLEELGGGKAQDVFARRVEGCSEIFERKGWAWLKRLDRVYDSSRAVEELGWKPEYTFERAVEKVGRGEEWRSELTLRVGKLGYHAVSTGVYTTR